MRQHLVREALMDKFHTNPIFGAALDMACTSALQPLSSDVVQVLIPAGSCSTCSLLSAEERLAQASCVS